MSDRCAIDGCSNLAAHDDLLCEDCRARLDRGMAASRRYAETRPAPKPRRAEPAFRLYQPRADAQAEAFRAKPPKEG